jgi:tetratricopeptide (TPR) repeat protein
MNAELLTAVEADPTNHAAFEALVTEVLAQADESDLRAIYDRVPAWAGSEGPDARLVQVLLRLARAAQEPAQSTRLHYLNGLLLWQRFGDEKRAEISFRKLAQPPPEPEILRRFFIDFYVREDNWRRLEQCMLDPLLGGFPDPIEARRELARVAEARAAKDRAVTFWQGVRELAPGDPEATERLKALYAEQGKWHALASLLRDNLAHSGLDNPVKTALHRQLIEIYAGPLPAPIKVISGWQAILQIDPTNREALDALDGALTTLERWPELVRVLQKKVALAGTGEAAVALKLQLAALLVDKLPNPAEAAKLYREVLGHDPTNRPARQALGRLFESRGDWEAYIELGEADLAALGDPAERAHALRQLARTATAKVPRPGVAIRLWESLRQAAPEDPEVLEELTGLFERGRRTAELAAILEIRLAGTPEPALRLTLLQKLAQAHASRADGASAATGAWRALLELEPDNRRAQAELRRLYLALQDWEGLGWLHRRLGTLDEHAHTLELAARQAGRADLWLGAARIWQDEVRDAERARVALERVRELEPRHPEAARRLLDVSGTLGRWEGLAELYTVALETTQDPGERAGLFAGMARALVHTRPPNLTRAFEALSESLALSPDTGRLPFLLELATISGERARAAQILAVLVPHLAQGVPRAVALCDLGGLRADLEGPEAACATYEEALREDPTSPAARAALIELYDRMGMAEDAARLREADLSAIQDPSVYLERALELANLWHEHLGRPRDAIGLLRGALTRVPDDEGASLALAHALIDADDPSSLAPLLEGREAYLTRRGAAPGLLADLACARGLAAELAGSGPQAAELALGHYRRALALDGNHAPTLAALEGLVGAPGLGARVALCLEPTYAHRGEFRSLADCLELALRELGPVQARVPLLERLAQLYASSLGDPDLAFGARVRILALRPQDEGAVRGLMAFCEERNEPARWRELVGALDELITGEDDAHARAALHAAAARTLRDRLGELREARAHFRSAIEATPEDLGLLADLEALERALGNHEGASEVLGRRAELSGGQDRLELLTDYGRRMLELGNRAGAILAAEKTLGLDATYLPARDLLDVAASGAELWDLVRENLLAMRELAADDLTRAASYEARLGALEQEAGQADAAIARYGAALSLDPSEPLALRELERLLEEDASFPSALAVLEARHLLASDFEALTALERRAADREGDPGARVERILQLARLEQKQGGDPLRALETLRAAWDVAPGRMEVALDLWSLAVQTKRVAEVAADLERGITGDPARAAELWEALLPITAGSGDQGALYYLHALVAHSPGASPEAAEVRDARIQAFQAMARVAEKELADPARAMAAWVGAFELGHPCGQDLARVAAAHGLWREVVRAFEARGRVADPEEATRLAFLRGELLADTLSDPEAAEAAFLDVLARAPDDVAALDRLEQLYEVTERWQPLFDVLGNQARLATDSEARAAFLVQRAQVAEQRLDDPVSAIEALEAVLAENPGSRLALAELARLARHPAAAPHAVRALAPAYRARGAWDELAGLLKTGFESEASGERRAELAADLAELAAGPQGAPQDAILWWLEALRASPDRDAWWQKAEVAAEQSDGPWALAELATELAASAPTEDRAVVMGHRAANWFAKLAAGMPRAEEALRHILEIAPRDVRAQTELDALYSSAGRWRDLAVLLGARLSAAEADGDRVVLLRRLAPLRRTQLGDPEGAAQCLRELIRLDDSDREAHQELCDILRAQGAWAELRTTIEVLVDLLPDEEERLLLGKELAGLCAGELGDPEAAAAVWEEILISNPKDGQAHRELERLLGALGRDAELADALTAELAEASPEPARQAELLRTLARLAEGPLHDPERAITAWDGLVREVPDDPEGWEALARLYRANDHLVGLERALRALSRSAPAEALQKVNILRDLARVCGEIGDPETGIEAWLTVWEAAPGDAETSLELEALYERTGRFSDLAAQLEARLALEESPELLRALIRRLAELREGELADPQGAVRAWEALYDGFPDAEDVGFRLEAAYQRDGNWQGLARIWEAGLAKLGDDFERLLQAQRLARLCQNELGDPRRAFAALVSVADLAEEDPALVDEIEALGRQIGQPEEIMRAYDSGLGRCRGPVVASLARRAAQLARQQGQDARAIGYLERLLAEEPGDEAALVALADLHSNAGDVAKLVRVLMELGGVPGDTPSRKQYLRTAAELSAEALKDEARTLECLLLLHRIDPLDTPTTSKLEGLLRRRGQWRELVELLDARADSAEDEVGVRVEVARIWAEELAEPEQAAERYEAVLALDPRNEVARAFLVHHHETSGQSDRLAVLHEDLLLGASDEAERVGLLVQLGELYGQAGKWEAAAEKLEEAVGLRPSHVAAIDALTQIHARAGRWSQVLELGERQLAGQPDPQIAARTLVMLAQVAEREFGDAERADGYWARVVEVDPQHAEALRWLAHRHESRGETATAIGEYGRLLVCDPTDRAAFESLSAACEALVMPDRLVEILAPLVGTMPADGLGLDAHLLLAGAYDALERTGEAQAERRAVLALDPDRLVALWPLCRSMLGEGRYAEALPLAQRLLTHRDSFEPPETAEAHLGLARSAAALGDEATALEHYLEAAQASPASALPALEAGMLLKQRGRADRALELYDAVLAVGVSADERNSVLLHAAAAAAELGDAERSTGYLDRLSHDHPDDPTMLERLAQACEFAGQWDRAAASLERLAKLRGDPRQRFQIEARLGVIHRERRNDLVAARAAFARAVECQPSSRECLQALVELAEAAKDPADTVRWLTRLAEVEPTADRRAAVWVRAGEILRDVLGREGEAAETFERALDMDPHGLKAFEALDKLHTRRKDWQALGQSYRKMLERTQKAGGDPARQAAIAFALYKNLGEIYRSRTKQLDQALDAYEWASKLRPTDQPVREIVVQLCQLTNAPPTRVIPHEQALLQQQPERFEGYRRLMLLYKKAGEPDRAWFAAGILSLMGRAEEAEEYFYSEYRRMAPPVPKRPLGPEEWAKLRPAGHDLALGEVFGVIYRGLGQVLSRKSLKDYGVRPKDRLVPADLPVEARAALLAINAPPFEMFVSPDQPACEIPPIAPMIMVVGGPLLQKAPAVERSFHFARLAIYAMPEHAMAGLLEVRELDVIFAAAASLVDPSFKVGMKADVSAEERAHHLKQVEAFKAQLERHLPAEGRTGLRAAIAKLASQKKPLRIGLWKRNVELTSIRAGLLLAGDVARVGTVLRDEESRLSKLTKSEKLKDLIFWGLGNEHAQLRKELGLEIDYSELFG